jgi:hypothetical protein
MNARGGCSSIKKANILSIGLMAEVRNVMRVDKRAGKLGGTCAGILGLVWQTQEKPSPT